MRLAVCALSAVLLSGCSWLGGIGNLGSGHNGASFGKSAQYGGQYASRHGGMASGQQNPCVVYSPRAPIPQGCDPASVTIGAASGGFPQQPNFGGGNYASAGYGSHASVAGQQAANYQPRKRLRKPKLRGTLSLGLEKSNAGSLLDYGKVLGLDPVGSYNPQDFNEGFDGGTEASGSVTSTTFTANADRQNLVDIFAPNSYESSSMPSISFDDVHSTPVRIAAGGEYILGPKTTLFANAGFSKSEGNSGEVASVSATLYQRVSEQPYLPDPLNLGAFIPDGAPLVSDTFIPGRQIARFSYDFTDMERVDLEAGARHYFNPLVKSQGFKTLSPFVGASVGASHYNAVSFDVTQEQAYYQRAFESSTGVTEDYYTVTGPNTRVDLYDSQWVPSGQLNAGVEWQVTPKTALAFESGLKFEGARKYTNGEKGDKNVAIPFTVRGSYNF